MNRNLAYSYQYCRNITKKYATNFYFASKLLDKEKRAAAFAVYAFSRFSDSLVDESVLTDKDHVYQNFLAFKRVCEHYLLPSLMPEFELESFEILKTKKDIDEAIKIFPAFLHTYQKYKLNKQWILDLILGIEMDLVKNRYQTFTQLDLYCYRVAGTIGLIMTKIAGYKDEKAFLYAENMGKALQLTNILRDVGEDLFERNRVYLPQEILTKFKVNLEDLKNKKITPEFKQVIKELILFNKQMYEKNWPGFKYLDFQARLGLKTACRLYAKILDKIEENNYDVLNKRAYTKKREKIWELMILVFNKPKAARFLPQTLPADSSFGN
jgi:phytoene synthase